MLSPVRPWASWYLPPFTGNVTRRATWAWLSRTGRGAACHPHAVVAFLGVMLNSFHCEVYHLFCAHNFHHTLEAHAFHSRPFMIHHRVAPERSFISCLSGYLGSMGRSQFRGAWEISSKLSQPPWACDVSEVSLLLPTGSYLVYLLAFGAGVVSYPQLER